MNNIHTQLEELTAMDRAQLAKQWQALFGVPAPNLVRQNLLRGAIAWHLQAKAMGGLTLVERRQIAAGKSNNKKEVSTGSRLVRVWQGKTLQVTVLENEYLYENQTWKSLSAIAKHITGTPWSGPVFFGLKKSGK